MENIESLLIENSVSAYYDVQENWLYLTWYGAQTIETRQYAFNQLLSFLTTTQCTKILNDNTFNTTTWNDCSFWMATDWLPQAEENGLRTMAWVYSTAPEARDSAKEMISHLSSSAIVIAFTDLNDAKNWLRSV